MGSLTVTATDASGATATASAAYTVGQAPELFEFVDFGVSGFSTGLMPAGDLVGKGSAVTRYRMRPDSATRPYTSTSTSVVATALIRVGWSGQKVNVQGLTVEGTHVGPGVSGGAEQEYHGLMSKGGAGSTISDVIVTGIPGHGSGPLPSGGETSSLQLLRAGSHTLTNVQLDGRRGGAGAGIAASLFEMNYMTAPMVWNGGRANYATGGFGAALFQCGGPITFNDVDFRFNRKAINIEQSVAGAYRFVRCDLRGMTGAMYVAQISTLGLTVSAQVIFEDCIYNDDILIVNTYTTAANKGQNGQKDSDIVRIDKGVVQPQGGPKFVLVHQ